MNKEFGCPAYGADGIQVLTTVDGLYQDALMDTFVYRLEAGEERSFFSDREEMAFLLIEGAVTFSWGGHTTYGARESCFDNGAQVCGPACSPKYACDSEGFPHQRSVRGFHGE